MTMKDYLVLNLVISGIPSIRKFRQVWNDSVPVLNLVISGIPSIHGYMVSVADIFQLKF